MAHDHRSERPTRRGPRRRLRRRHRGRPEALLPPHAAGRERAPATATSSSSPAGRSSRATTTSRASTGSCSPQHHEGLIATTGCLGGHVLQSLLQGDEQGRAGEGRPAAGDLRARQPVRRAAGPRPAGAARDQPEADRAGHEAARPAAGDERLALHPPRGPRVPRRPAVRADRRRAVGPQALQVRGPRALPEDRRRDALPVPGGARRRATTRCGSPSGPRWRSTSAAPQLPELPAARGLHRRRRVPRPRHVGGRPRALGRRRLGDRQAAHPVRARHRSRRWGSARTSSSCGTSSATPGRGASASARAAARRPAAPSPTACGSPTSTRSATTCCSSASSTPAASRCPTSTWTSTPATGTR